MQFRSSPEMGGGGTSTVLLTVGIHGRRLLFLWAEWVVQWSVPEMGIEAERRTKDRTARRAMVREIPEGSSEESRSTQATYGDLRTCVFESRPAREAKIWCCLLSRSIHCALVVGPSPSFFFFSLPFSPSLHHSHPSNP